MPAPHGCWEDSAGWGLCHIRAPLHRSGRPLVLDLPPTGGPQAQILPPLLLATATVVWQAHPGRLGQRRCWLAAPLIIRDMSLGPRSPAGSCSGEGTLEERGALAESCEAQATSVPSGSFLGAKGPAHTTLSSALLPSPALATASQNPSPRRPHILPGLLPAQPVSTPTKPSCPAAISSRQLLMGSWLLL